MNGRRIVVVGGGFGGVAAARTACALLDARHEVTLIDRTRRTFLCGGFPLLIAGEREAQGLSRSLGQLANRGIRYVEAEVDRIDLDRRAVLTGDGSFGYDYLVLSPGAGYDWRAVPGSADAYSFYSLETARRLRRRLSRLREGRIVIAITSLPYKCPPAPFEAAMVLDWLFKRRGSRRDIQLDVFTPEPAPLKVAGPEATRKLVSELARRRIGLHTGAGVKEVRARGVSAAFSDGSEREAEVVITVPAHRPAPLVAQAGLVGDSGWVDVDPGTLETKAAGVFAIGDTNTVPMATGMGLPKAGVFAAAEGETVGHNIAADINGRPRAAFAGEGYCFLAAGGDRSGVLEGKFLAVGKPEVQYRSATARGMRRKERFEEDWRRFRV